MRRYAFAVHSVDRPGWSTRSAGEGELGVFLELDLSGDPGRGGVGPTTCSRSPSRSLATPGLRLRGVMAVAPLGVEPARAFTRVREASEQLRALAPEATAISAGMSGDFEAAIREGATHLRIGTAITGKRPDRD